MCYIFYNSMTIRSTPFDISDILQLVESIPIDNKLKIKIGAKVPLDNESIKISERLGLKEKTISFKDIVILLNKFIKGIYVLSNNSKNIHERQLSDLHQIGYNYPSQYLLFDFCLAALDGDHLDAKLYLAHASNIIGLSNQLNLLLSAIVYTPLTSYAEIRELLTLLALEVQPANIETYNELYGKEFQKRYKIYQNEIIKL